MVFEMKSSKIKFADNELHLHFSSESSRFVDNDLLSDVQSFVEHIPFLNVDEPFYFGFWRVCVRRLGGVMRLCEWDFNSQRFIDHLDRSVILWNEQRVVVRSQGLPWTSVRLDDVLYCTPSVFCYPQKSIIEGVKDSLSIKNGSGWMLYTSKDRDQNLPFKNVMLHEALRDFNVNVLRFLCLPDGWTFNIQLNGESHVWEERLS